MVSTRIFIYPSDIALLTGKHITTCRRIYNQILDSLGKTKRQGLTIKEYCKYNEIPEESITSKKMFNDENDCKTMQNDCI